MGACCAKPEIASDSDDVWPAAAHGPFPKRQPATAPPRSVATGNLPGNGPRPIPFAGPGGAGLIAFYFPGHEEEWDRLCQSGFLGNFYLLDEPMHLEAPKQPGRGFRFSNAEAAFQALKFWDRAAAFQDLSGSEAFHRKKSLQGQEDFTYAGFGSNWAGMMQVLRAKFRPGTKMAALLESTKDAFLLEHNAKTGRDKIWSDNFKGDGLNWLGLQLMLVRDESRAHKPWTAWLAQHVDLRTGKVDQEWQQTVRFAVQTLNQSLAMPARV